MFLAVCATELELQPLLDTRSPEADKWMTLVTGVGMVETSLCLTRFLERHGSPITAVLNFGVGGAYVREERGAAGLLQICLAEGEVFGDLGICHGDRIEPLADSLLPHSSFSLAGGLLDQAEGVLRKSGLPVRRGNFVTVCGVSGSARRGKMLGSQYDGLCENMEGAAVARVCAEYGLPLLEMRSISNFVEDRDPSRWKLDEACGQAAEAAAILLRELTKP